MNSGSISIQTRTKNKYDQSKTPIATALKQESLLNPVAFDVPGHKGNLKALGDFFGETCLKLDKNSRPSIDNLSQPTGVIKEAEELLADAFGSNHAFFMVNGTTSTVQAMVLCAIKPGDKIIMPRNVHVSVINAVILAGGVPVYVDPGVHEKFGIPLGVSEKDMISAIEQNVEAKAVLVNNPTYYGVCSPIKKIVERAHERGMTVLADEAHGTHFYFGDNLPISAIKAGADYSAVSMHKTGGSLTQSSVLLVGKNVDVDHVRNIINLTMTTSASYLLLASIDIARKNLFFFGRQKIGQLKDWVKESIEKISQIEGFIPLTRENMTDEAVADFDCAKLAINTTQSGLVGIEVYYLLREKYNIQLEFGDIGNILAIPSVGDEENYGLYLADALKDISLKYSKKQKTSYCYEYIKPIVKIPPRDAFYYPKEKIDFKNSIGRISGEYVMCYPPGIPILAPGELITSEVIEHIEYSREKGCKIIGVTGESLTISVVK